jgi:hypothetical protein
LFLNKNKRQENRIVRINRKEIIERENKPHAIRSPVAAMGKNGTYPQCREEAQALGTPETKKPGVPRRRESEMELRAFFQKHRRQGSAVGHHSLLPHVDRIK